MGEFGSRRHYSGPSPAAVLRVLPALIAFAFALFLAAPVHAQEAVVLFDQPGDVIFLRVSPSKTMAVRMNVDFADLVVGNPDIADVVPLTSRSLYIQAKAAGRTNIAIYDKDKDLVGVLDLEIGLDLEEIAAAILDAAPNSNVRVSAANQGIRLSGSVPDGLTLQTVLDVASEFTDRVINTIRVKDAQQVLLEVRFIEATRSSGRDLGVSWGGGNRNGFFCIGCEPKRPGGNVLEPGTLSLPGLLSGAVPFGTVVANVISAGINVDVVVRALETKGLARRLAEPNLTATSGQTASFLAGGEFPITVTDENGNQNTTFKEYGVRLTFTPTVLDKGLISISLVPEVSDIDPTLSVQGVPALLTRRTETTVELYDGQSFAISGLLNTRNIKTQEQLPWIGQVPVLGALFRSASYQKQQTDLVVIVTVHLVRPARPGEPLRSPLDQTVSANDAEFFLLGLMEVTPERIAAFEQGAGVKGPFGHIIDIPKEGAYAVQKP